MSIFDVILHKDVTLIGSYVKSIYEMPQIFLGILSPSYYSKAYLSFILFIRLVAMGFFMSIIIKRFNRR